MTALETVAGFASLCLLLLGPLPASVGIAAVLDVSLFRLGRAHLALMVGIVWVAVQALVALVLGVSNSLSFGSLHVAEIAVALLGLLIWRPWMPEIRRALDLAGDLPAGVDGTNGVIVATALVFLCIDLAWRSMAWVTRDYDTLAYHLPTMINWYRSGAFVPFAQWSQDQIGSYPYTWEALSTLFLFPFGNASATQLPNVLAWTLLGLATYRVAVTIGATSLCMLFPQLRFFSPFPSICYQTTTLHVDLAFGALFAAAVYCLSSGKERFVGRALDVVASDAWSVFRSQDLRAALRSATGHGRRGSPRVSRRARCPRQIDFGE